MRRFFILVASVILAFPVITTANELVLKERQREKQKITGEAKAKISSDAAVQTAIPKKDKEQRHPPVTPDPQSKAQQTDGHISPVPKKHEILIGNELSDD
jgi:hypothetical protein